LPLHVYKWFINDVAACAEWTEVGPLSDGRVEMALLQLHSGLVLACGGLVLRLLPGQDDSWQDDRTGDEVYKGFMCPTKSVEVYNPATNSACNAPHC
jgi:hypothetical protein